MSLLTMHRATNNTLPPYDSSFIAVWPYANGANWYLAQRDRYGAFFYLTESPLNTGYYSPRWMQSTTSFSQPDRVGYRYYWASIGEPDGWPPRLISDQRGPVLFLGFHSSRRGGCRLLAFTRGNNSDIACAAYFCAQNIHSPILGTLFQCQRRLPLSTLLLERNPE